MMKNLSVIHRLKISERLKQAAVKPKKNLGQNFLVNEGIYRKIIKALEIKPDDTVIEIGPGLGTLTDYLAGLAGQVIAVEKDRQLADYLREHFRNHKNVIIINEDILKSKIEKLKIKNYAYKLVGNIPYYLTSRLIKTIFESWPRPKIIVFMLQKEVAQRITARPPKMSLLAVSVQYYSKPEIISYVSKGSFFPTPRVDSAIVKFETRDKEQETRDKQEWFFRVVKAGFAGKRKQLGNNLARNLNLPKDIVESKLLSLEIDPKRRAETLTVEEWQKIAEILYA